MEVTRQKLERQRAQLALEVEEGRGGEEKLEQVEAALSRLDRDSERKVLAAKANVGPVTREVFDKADRLIEKSARKLDRMEAVVKVLNANPELYARYVKEVELSTAVG